MAKFLDLAGLEYAIGKIKTWAQGVFVPSTRKVNGKNLNADITLSAADVQAIPASQKGAANGVAELDASGKVPAAQLPSYVDDVIEGYLHTDGKFYEEAGHTTAVTGEAGKIYVDITSGKNLVYRWSGNAFVEIAGGLALGETESTAYRGDRGKIAYDHSQTQHAPADATKTEKSNTNGNVKINDAETVVYTHPAYTAKVSGLYKVTVDAQGHVSAAAAAAKTDITALGIPGQDTTYDEFSTGNAGLVPAPASGDAEKYLKGDGTWGEVEVPEVEAITTTEIDDLFATA